LALATVRATEGNLAPGEGFQGTHQPRRCFVKIDYSHPSQSKEPLTTRYFENDLEMIDSLSKKLNLKRSVIPSVAIRVLFTLSTLPYLSLVLAEVHSFNVRQKEMRTTDSDKEPKLYYETGKA